MGGFSFEGRLYHWRDEPTSWVFVDLPAEVADDIEDEADTTGLRRGFGSVRVRATIGETSWETSLFPSAEQKTFVLPVKKPVRRAEGVEPGDVVAVSLTLLH